MKSFMVGFAFLIIGATSNAKDIVDELAEIEPSSLDRYKYPALAGELPAETQARVALLKFLDQLKAEGKLTLELELQIRAQIAAILSAEAARMAKDMEPPNVIVIDR